ncbi:MAG TPA: hypothetical protein VGX68_17845 [Thermoanaerobaculia bacterium]|nr:hypothetical protein [Thermoanaerobaculia bacterium]
MRIRTLGGIVLLLLAVLPARAQEQTLLEPARFLIEKITVAGPKEAAANIVQSETLLREGETYTEDQLRQAVYRVHRLPFVLDASFSLRKGSQRGAYELLIEVQPARWFFYDQWNRFFRSSEPLDLEEHALELDRTSLSADILVGARLFVGRSGVLFADLNSQDGVEAGFTKYDLFHRGILASAGLSWNSCCVREVLPLALDPTFSSWSFERSRKISLGVSFPLSGPQSLQVSLSDRHGDAGTLQPVLGTQTGFIQFFDFSSFVLGGDLDYRRAEAKWVFDTTDDPLVPSRGLSLSAGVEASQLRALDLVAVFRPGLFEEPVETPFSSSRSEQWIAAGSAIRHWSLTPRQTVSGSGRVAIGQSRIDNLAVGERILGHADVDYVGGSLGIQHALTLKRSREPGDFSDLRLETGAEAGLERTSPDLGPSPLRRIKVWMGFVFRNQWGRVRILLTYLDLGKSE